MTVIITSSLRIGLVSGTGVNIDSPVVPQFTTDDIYDSQNPSQTLTDMFNGISSETLAGTISVDGLATGNHAIYTVPAGDLFIPTKAVLYPTTITGTGTTPTISLGWTASFQELVNSQALTALSAVGKLLVFSNFASTGSSSGANYTTVSGGQVITIRVSTAAVTYTAYTFKILLFGFTTQ